MARRPKPLAREGTCGNGPVVTPAPRRRSTSPRMRASATDARSRLRRPGREPHWPVASGVELSQRHLPRLEGNRGGVALHTPAASAGSDLVVRLVGVSDFPFRPVMHATRQAILPHMWSPHVDRRARHRNSTAMCVILHYPVLRPDGTSAATALLASATAFEMVSPGVVSVGAASSWTSASAEVASPRVRLRNSMNSSNWSRTPTSTPSGCSARTSQPRLVI